MNALKSGWQRRVWPGHEWLLPATIFLLVALGSMGASSFFLHFDSSLMHVEAVDLLRGCWGTAGSKPIVSFLLTGVYAVGGPHPVYEIVLLMLTGAVTAASLFSLTAHLSGSKRWAMLGTLWFVSQPTILYYTRMHMGYPLAAFTLGLLLYVRRRYGWAGLAFGVAVPMHVSFVLPLGAWLAIAFVVGERPRRAADLGRLAAGLLLPLIVVDAVYFLYDGILFGWERKIIRDVLYHGPAYEGTGAWPDVWRAISFSNGALNAALLLSGLAYPLVRKPRVRLMDAAFVSGWVAIVFYTLDAGVRHGLIRPRMWSGAYPLLTVTATFTLMRLAARLRERLSPRAWPFARALGAGLVALALPWTLIAHTLDAAAGSRTAYHEVSRAMAQAAEEGLPVRYFGRPDVGAFFGVADGVEVVTNEFSPDIISRDANAVWVFEGEFAGPHPMLAKARSDSRIDPADYTISRYAHLVPYRPHVIEERPIGGRDLVALREQPYVRSPGAEAASLEIWWPRHPQAGAFEARNVLPGEGETFVVHYAGSGCLSTRPYGDGTQNYYDLLAQKGHDLGSALASGDREAVRELLRSALEDFRRRVGG